jgi:hypothetical protein
MGIIKLKFFATFAELFAVKSFCFKAQRQLLGVE